MARIFQGKKPVFGIIGGIGAGKSTVARMLADLGCGLVDADAIAHEALRQPAIAADVVRILGQGICTPSGEIDRRKVAARVFGEPEQLRRLTEILHPHVLREAERLIEAYFVDKTVPAVVLDMPLLLEVGWADRCDCVIFVRCDPKIRKVRLALKEGTDTADMACREKVQISLDSKARRADNTIDNNSGLSALVSQVTEIFTRKTVNR